MFEIGFWEIALIGLVALLVVGPERLPALARTVGLWTGKLRRMAAQVKEDIEREVRADELRKSLDEAKALREAYESLEDTKRDLESAAGSLDDARRDLERSEPEAVEGALVSPAAGSIRPPEEEAGGTTRPEGRDGGDAGEEAPQPNSSGASEDERRRAGT